MSAVAAILREAWGLFVDDGVLVVLALLWVAVSWWLLPLLVAPVAAAGLLFAGLAAALAISVMRA